MRHLTKCILLADYFRFDEEKPEMVDIFFQVITGSLFLRRNVFEVTTIKGFYSRRDLDIPMFGDGFQNFYSLEVCQRLEMFKIVY